MKPQKCRDGRFLTTACQVLTGFCLSETGRPTHRPIVPHNTTEIAPIPSIHNSLLCHISIFSTNKTKIVNGEDIDLVLLLPSTGVTEATEQTVFV